MGLTKEQQRELRNKNSQKYQRKSPVVDAMRITELTSDPTQWPDWLSDIWVDPCNPSKFNEIDRPAQMIYWSETTRSGALTEKDDECDTWIALGDWLIRDERGKILVLRDEDFWSQYDLVE